MRITNDTVFNPHPINGTEQPSIFWGTDRPDATSTFTSQNVGTEYLCKPAAGLVEKWVRMIDSTDTISDWRCVSGVLSERISIVSFTDGGAAAGTLVITADLPAGAYAYGSQVSGVVGWAGDTSAVLIIGDGTDADRYCTTGYNVFTTGDYGAAVTNVNVPSGNRAHATAMTTITITVTTASDFTSALSNASGRATVSIFYQI